MFLSFLILKNNFFGKNFQVLQSLKTLPKITTKWIDILDQTSHRMTSPVSRSEPNSPT